MELAQTMVAHSLADKGVSDNRQTLMRRAISTAYYAAFPSLRRKESESL
jgi:hypothetical protein